MKLSVLFLGIVMSSVSFGASILNDVKVSNLPTAAKSYFQIVDSMNEAMTLKSSYASQCVKEKAETEAYLTKMGSTILSSVGCVSSIEDNSSCDQGGCGAGILVKTSFEIVFK